MTNRIVVCDIDGTLADISHRRHWVANRPKNWTAFTAGISRDAPHADICDLVAVLRNSGCDIILCSGRGEETRAVTQAWLAQQGIEFTALYLRAAADHRPDHQVKVELLAKIRAQQGEPWLWLDDRNSVVDAIRAQGVRVLQVAQGNF